MLEKVLTGEEILNIVKKSLLQEGLKVTDTLHDGIGLAACTGMRFQVEIVKTPVTHSNTFPTRPEGVR